MSKTETAEAKAAKKTCFIVGPIGEAGSAIRQLADWLLKGIIKPVLEADEFDYIVKRADHDTDPGSITNAVISDLINADLVVADLTGFNPNAFYELGIRHAVRKPAVHIIAENVKLPFDNADQRTIFVDITNFDNVEDAKRRLERSVRAINADGYQVSNPVTLSTAVTALKQSSDPRDQVILRLEERLSKLEEVKPTRNVYNDLIAKGLSRELAKAHSLQEANEIFNSNSTLGWILNHRDEIVEDKSPTSMTVWNSFEKARVEEAAIRSKRSQSNPSAAAAARIKLGRSEK